MKPTRKFNGVTGQRSVDTMGPETLSADLDAIIKMFNPDAVHTDGSKGGIGFDNLNFSFGDSGSTSGQSMAEKIGSKAITGISGTTVWNQLNAIVTMILDRYTKAEVKTLTATETNDLVRAVDVNLSTGVITVTKKDGSMQKWDTQLEKVPATFEFVEVGGMYYIKITNVDGSTSQTDVTALMNHYTFNDSQDVVFTSSGQGPEKVVTASIKANSIGIDKLSLSAVSALEGYVSSAMGSAGAAQESAVSAKSFKQEAAISADSASLSKQSAEASSTIASDAATEAMGYKNQAASSASDAALSNIAAGEKVVQAESWAIGGTGIRPGEETNNAKYWSDKAKEAAGGDFATQAELSAEITSRISADDDIKGAMLKKDGSVQMTGPLKTMPGVGIVEQINLGTSKIYMSSDEPFTVSVASNCYYDGTNWRYLNNGVCAVMTLSGASSGAPIYAYTAVSGVKDAIAPLVTKNPLTTETGLPLTGGTVTGDIAIKKTTNPGLALMTPSYGSTAIWKAAGSSAEYGSVIQDADGLNNTAFLCIKAAEPLHYCIGITYRSDGVYRPLYGTHNITISNSSPTGALSEGTQHQVY